MESGERNKSSKEEQRVPETESTATHSVLRNIRTTGTLSGMPSSPSQLRKSTSQAPAKTPELPLLIATEPEERPSLFMKKLELCSIIFDLSNHMNNARAVELKRQTLQELIHFLVEDPTRDIIMTSEVIYRAVFAMISKNLFNHPAVRRNPLGEMYDPEEDEPMLNPHWHHIEIVYEFCIRFLESPEFNAGMAKQCFQVRQFILQVLELFNVEDPRERDYLKTLLHRMYLKFVTFRHFVRQEILNVCTSFVFESRQHNGIAELLEIMASIINGFQVPLREEHKKFLFRGLLPLFKARNFSAFSSQLTHCIGEYLEKDPSLIQPVFHSLVKVWPKTNCSKAVQFITTLHSLLKVVDVQYFSSIQIPFFKQLAKWIGHQHFLISERALALLTDEYFVGLISDNIKALLPIIFESLYVNSRNHWHRDISTTSYNILSLFMEFDFPFFNQCCLQYKLSKNEPAQLVPPAAPVVVEQTHIDLLPTKTSGVRKKSLLPQDPKTAVALMDWEPRQENYDERSSDSPRNGIARTDSGSSYEDAFTPRDTNNNNHKNKYQGTMEGLSDSYKKKRDDQ